MASNLRTGAGILSVLCFVAGGVITGAGIAEPALEPVLVGGLAAGAVSLGGWDGLAGVLLFGIGYLIEQAVGESGLSRAFFYLGALILLRALVSDAKLMIFGMLSLIIEFYRFTRWVATWAPISQTVAAAVFLVSVPVIGYGSLTLFLHDRPTLLSDSSESTD